MAGIIASTSSKVMGSGDTSPTDVEGGYVAGEPVALSTFPTGSVYSWGLSTPAGSPVTTLDDPDGAAPTFTPPTGYSGEYLVTCNVDGVAYSLRMTVTAAVPMSTSGALRHIPVDPDAVPTPASGHTVFSNSTTGKLCAKLADGSVEDLY